MKEKEYVKDEIRKEFQLERMVLFSDAVFAIVITLMAIEIRLPDFENSLTNDFLVEELKKLIPVIISYTVSFLFIGLTWYQHLKIFSLLKSYDKGLVIRNLLMLFFIGLFPFGASVMAKFHNNFLWPVGIYFFVIVTSRGAQLILHHYILFKRPNLRINVSIEEELLSFKKSKIAVITLSVAFICMWVSYQFNSDPNIATSFGMFFIPVPFIIMYFRRRLNKAKTQT